MSGTFCIACSSFFTVTRNLNRHMEEFHPVAGLQLRYECRTCRRQFTRRDNYRRHYQSQHWGPPPPARLQHVILNVLEVAGEQVLLGDNLNLSEDADSTPSSPGNCSSNPIVISSDGSIPGLSTPGSSFITWNRTPSGTPPSSPPTTSLSFDNLLSDLDLSTVSASSGDSSLRVYVEHIPLDNDRGDDSLPLGTPPVERSEDELSYYSRSPATPPSIREHDFMALFDLPDL